ncbi:hypothetical protein [Cyanobium sp. WAJ14-Wanaka]|uniref:hypothetical protein n=1 Tax=Cyanobium sp. WAJ14-Wanaka TaxID=2823725 RepID=UPI0020CC7038|nr:hypothetical protein [Cyanobium sp. WAJ14-Wanaka]MCP9775959.1 hypothetical protein [Cyanobium sp. WAJ14-Wanaka]
MNDPSSDLRSLLSTYQGQEDIQVDALQPDLRLNLLDTNIKLWGTTYQQIAGTGDNLLLACNNSTGPVEEAVLTWVVGAAIRSLRVEGKDQFTDLLKCLGIKPELISSLLCNCPGISGKAIWAIYLERHGYLVATPILSAGLGLVVANQDQIKQAN